MPERDINIRLKLLDEFSANMKEFSKQLQNVVEKTEHLGKSMRQIGGNIVTVGRTMTFIGAGLTAPLILAYKSAEKYSAVVRQETERFNNTLLNLRVSIAEALSPVIHKLVNILGNLIEKWNNLSPSMKQAIIQGTFLTGVYLTLGGIITSLIGKLVKLFGIITILTTRFVNLLLVHPILAGILASIGLIIIAMWKWKAVADVIISTFEIIASGLFAIFDLIKLTLWQLVSWFHKAMSALVEILAKLPKFLGGKVFKEIADGLKILGNKFQEFADNNMQRVIERCQKIGKIITGEERKWAKGFDNLKLSVKGIDNTFENLSKDINLPKITESFNAIGMLAQGTAQAMTNAFSNLFFNVFTGQIRDIKNIFIDFGNAILRTLSEVLAKWILIHTIGKLPFFAGIFHQGGIVKAHSGLATDEIPIIAQTGEGIISRRGMATLGSEGLRKINRGEGIGRKEGTVFNIFIQAIDTKDFRDRLMENPDIFESAIMSAVDRSKTIRHLLMQRV